MKKSKKSKDKKSKHNKSTEEKKPRKQSFSWNTAAHLALVEGYIAAVSDRLSSDNGLKNKGWHYVAKHISTESLIDKHPDSAQCKNAFAGLKAIYKVYHALMENSGFGKDPYHGGPTAPDSIWDAYIKVHPKAAAWQEKAWPLYNKVNEAIAGKVISGDSMSTMGDLSDSESDSSSSSFESSLSESSMDKAPHLKKRPVNQTKDAPKKKKGGMAMMVEAVESLRKVGVLEHATTLLWDCANITKMEATAMAELFSSQKGLALVFVGLPENQRPGFVCRHLPPILPQKSTLENALEILFCLDLTAEEKNRATSILINESDKVIFLALLTQEA